MPLARQAQTVRSVTFNIGGWYVADSSAPPRHAGWSSLSCPPCTVLHVSDLIDPGVSVIMTVLNEERHLAESVRAILDQKWAGPLELIVALGPSHDKTDEVAADLAAVDSRMRLVQNPSGRTPAGLNAALAVARHDVVVRVDGHALLPRDYVARAVDTLRRTGADNVGGVMAATGRTTFEKAVALAMTSKLGVGSAAFHTGGIEGPVDTVYLGAFRRSAITRVGGYDEGFERAQDWELNHRIRTSGGVIWFDPQMRVEYRPRGTVRKLARQYFQYGSWRREMMRRHDGTVNLRYLAAPTAVAAMALGTAAAVVGTSSSRLSRLKLGIVAPLGYLAAISVGGMAISRGEDLSVRQRVPVALATMHCSWGTGFLLSRSKS